MAKSVPEKGRGQEKDAPVESAELLALAVGPSSGRLPSPPTETLKQLLSFDQITWEDFERLCYRLAKVRSEIEHCAIYGRAGQKQYGIDIYARKQGGRYETWQAKRHKRFSSATLRRAVSDLQKGSWFAKSDTFFVAVQSSISDTDIQQEIETQVAALKAKGCELRVLGGHELTDLLRNRADLVIDFFVRPWAKQLLGDSLPARDAERLCAAPRFRSTSI